MGDFGMKNFLKDQTEKCVVCGIPVNNPNARVKNRVIHCKSCQGALCRNHSSGMAMIGGPYTFTYANGVKETGLCATCYNNRIKFQPTTWDSIINNVKTAQKMIDKSENTDKIIDSIFKNIN